MLCLYLHFHLADHKEYGLKLSPPTRTAAYLTLFCRPRPKNANVQYEARTLPPSQREEIVKSQDIGEFLKEVIDR